MPLPTRPDDDPRPDPPERPDNDACCHCGCDPCIFDLYDAEVARWRAEIAAWEKRKPAAGGTRTHAPRDVGDKPEGARAERAVTGRDPAVNRAGKTAPVPAHKPVRKPKA
ncbi:oxidoreductase-like domain-containing protein [Paraburkholderia adhaesiva]|uniref:oxidoreductase-like domain-containing protein n=1 Tax=Paraburkholderia adhaesiva TaxID=2883244 RepID=UPI001F3B7F09|nr:oxidoreductase-like domain-containing protein [Paraburkholderia adhaesiva]